MDRSTYDRREERLCVPSLDVTQTTEAGGELTMPDYYPEIRRVVSVTADALPDSKYLSEGSLEAGGTLAFTLLYIGDDGTLSSVPYVTEYTHKVPVGRDFTGGSSDVRTESQTEAVSCRPLAPRTVSLKAKVKSRISADRSEECALKITASGEGSADRRALERLEAEIPTVFRRAYSATGNLTGEMSAPQGSKPVLCRGEILIDNVRTANGSITVKGNAAVTCLVLTKEGIYKTAVCSLPFEERISADGATEAHVAAAFGRAAAVNVSTDGESDTMGVDVEYDIDALAAIEETLFVTDDVYSTQHTLEKKARDLNVLSLVCLENASVGVQGEGRRKSERGDGDYIIDSRADAVFERVDIKDNKAVFTGNCTFKAIIASGGECITEEFDVPVKYECPAPEGTLSKDCIWHAHTAAKGVECRIDEGKITGRCELFCYLEAVKSTKCSPVTEAVVGARDVTGDGGADIRISYPVKGQRIWDVAKEKRARLGDVERINHVDRHALSDGTPLIIK